MNIFLQRAHAACRLSTLRLWVSSSLLLALALLQTAPPAQAQGGAPSTRPNWQMVTAEPVAPAAARELLFTQKRLPLPRAVKGLPASETEATPEITALARALRNDPKLIFDYVHNYIEYVPTFGSTNGATATLLAGRGNDWDQTSLFIALLRAAGYTAEYVVGDVTYTSSRLANWVGSSAAQAGNVFASGGVPIAGVSGGFRITRVWAQAVIGSTTYVFDPAMKEYQDISGINLATASGYNQTTFMANAQQGATVTTDYVQNMNEPNIRADLATYSTNLVNYIRANNPTASVAQVIGGRAIVASEMTSYSTSLPYAVSVTNQTTYSAIPDTYRHLMRVEHVGIDRTFKTFEFAARRMTIFYRSSDNAPELRVDGTLIATGNATTSGTRSNLTVTIDHPYAAQSGSYADQSATFSLKSQSAYAIMHDFGGVSAALLANRNRMLTLARYQGSAETSESVRGETLALLGFNWFQEERLYTHLLERLGNIVALQHHGGGLVGQEAGYYFDIGMGVTSFVSTDGVSNTFAAFRAHSMMTSAFEHGVLEQLQSSAIPAVSTIRAVQYGNGLGNRTFLATSSNWSTVRSQLQNYPSGLLDSFQSALADSSQQFLLPQDGRMILNQWRGTGWIDYYFTGSAIGMGMLIYGGYAGGSSTYQAQLESYWTKNYFDKTYRGWDQYKGKYTPEQKEPVDMATGVFVYHHDDLAVGLDEPLGLSFTRSYSSRGNLGLGTLGYGWAHNYDSSVSSHSDGEAGLGARTPTDAASLIVHAYIALDLLKNQLNVQGWSIADVATKWAMDQLIDNAVSLQAGVKAAEFIRLANGDYNSSPYVALGLTSDASGFHILDRAGTRYDFDTNGRWTTWRDANNNTLTLTHSSGKLTTVTDAFGRTLTFGYTGNLLTSVTDAGRTLAFAYTSNNLTTFTDARGNNWGYEYDSLNRMTKVKKASPATQALVTNVYDELERVQTQTDGLGNTTTFFFSGYRNVERDADSTELTFIFDARGNYISRIDQQGNRFYFTYDGLSRLIQATDRLGDSIAFTYHLPTNQIASITNARGNTTTYTFSARTGSGAFTLYDRTRVDYPDSTNEQFTYDAQGNNLTHRDGAGQTTTNTYNARGQPLTSTNPTGGIITNTYNGDGTLASTRDSETGTTTFQYDTYKRVTRINYPDATNRQFTYNANDLVTQITDRSGAIYTFEYDANNNLTRVVRASGAPIQQTNQYQYDALDRLVKTIDPASQETQFAYTFWNGLSSITYPGDSQVNLLYDSRHWLRGLTDQAGKTWQMSRDKEGVSGSITTPTSRLINLLTDKLGMITQVTDPLGNKVKLDRDAMERIVKITDRLNRETTIGRDGEGRITSITLPIIGAVTYTRNGLGRITRITDQRGNNWDFGYTTMGRINQIKDPLNQTWTYSYDPSGRLSQITYPDSVTETRTYDANDNLTRRSFSDGLNLTYTYDALNRLTATGSVAVSITYDNRDKITNTQMGGANFSATYDARQRLQTVTYAGQMTVTYTYDARGLVTQATDNLTNAWVRFTYDDDGLLIKIERSNGITTDIERNANGRITRIKHGTKGEMTFTLDAEDQITQIVEQLPLDVASFISPELAQYAYNTAHQITSAGFAYDSRGRRTADPERAYTWDSADRLTGIVRGAASISYEYTGSGEVAKRTLNGVTTDFYYNYAVRDHPIVAEKLGGSYVRFYIYTPDGRLLYYVNVPTLKPFFYHFNQIGTTLFLTDDAGNVTDSYGYSPYGQLLKHDGSNDQPFTFVGQYSVRQEGDTGLYHMRARYYDSKTLRFLSRDPVWPQVTDPKSLNPYQYVGQNPLSFIDPSGLDYFVDAWGKPIGYSGVMMSGGVPIGRVDEKSGEIQWHRYVGDVATGKLIPVNEPDRPKNIRELRQTSQVQTNTSSSVSGSRELPNKPPISQESVPYETYDEQEEYIGISDATSYVTSSSSSCCSLLRVEPGASSFVAENWLPLALIALGTLMAWFGARAAVGGMKRKT